MSKSLLHCVTLETISQEEQQRFIRQRARAITAEWSTMARSASRHDSPLFRSEAETVPQDSGLTRSQSASQIANSS
jgi:hypothetical protein